MISAPEDSSLETPADPSHEYFVDSFTEPVGV